VPPQYLIWGKTCEAVSRRLEPNYDNCRWVFKHHHHCKNPFAYALWALKGELSEEATFDVCFDVDLWCWVGANTQHDHSRIHSPAHSCDWVSW